MLISEQDAIEGARVLPIGRIKATSAWHAVGHAGAAHEWRARILRELVRRAEDFDADAVIAVDYRIEPVEGRDETGIELERVCATGIAVRLAHAA